MRKSILWFVFLTLLTIQSAFAQSFYVILEDFYNHFISKQF